VTNGGRPLRGGSTRRRGTRGRGPSRCRWQLRRRLEFRHGCAPVDAAGSDRSGPACCQGAAGADLYGGAGGNAQSGNRLVICLAMPAVWGLWTLVRILGE
jgi:hypothetical protein